MIDHVDKKQKKSYCEDLSQVSEYRMSSINVVDVEAESEKAHKEKRKKKKKKNDDQMGQQHGDDCTGIMELIKNVPSDAAGLNILLTYYVCENKLKESVNVYKLIAASDYKVCVSTLNRLLYQITLSDEYLDLSVSIFDRIQADLMDDAKAHMRLIEDNRQEKIELYKSTPEKLIQGLKKKLEAGYSLLIRSFTRCKNIAGAVEVLNRALKDPFFMATLRLFSPIIHAYSENNEIEGAICILKQLFYTNKVDLDSQTILKFISAFGREGKFTEANNLLVKLGAQLSNEGSLIKFDECIRSIFNDTQSKNGVLIPVLMEYNVSESTAVCSHCKDSLGVNDLTKTQLAEFRKYLYAYITTDMAGNTIGRHVQALKYFMKWMYTHGQYDIIVDGANLAFYNQNNRVEMPEGTSHLPGSYSKNKRQIVSAKGFNYKQLQLTITQIKQRFPTKRMLVFLHQIRITTVATPEDLAFLEELHSNKSLYIVPHGCNDDIVWMLASIIDLQVSEEDSDIMAYIKAYELETGSELELKNPVKYSDKGPSLKDHVLNTISCQTEANHNRLSTREQMEVSFSDMTFDKKYALNRAISPSEMATDPYFHRIIVTNDQLRDHDFRLNQPNWYSLWRKRHVVPYTITHNMIALKIQPNYTLGLQYTDNYRWHIPTAPTQPTIDYLNTHHNKTNYISKDILTRAPNGSSTNVIWFCAKFNLIHE